MQWLIALILLVAFDSSAFAELSGWTNLNNTTTKQYENGAQTSAVDTFNQNAYLSLGKPITPTLSYQVYLRETLTNTRTTDSSGKSVNSYQRTAEPAVDFFLRNPMYNFDAGYRRQEQWSAASLTNEHRKSTDFYYSRLNITPFEFPFFLLQYDSQKDYDYLSPRVIDTSTERFSASSGYKLLYKGLDLGYNLYYTRSTNETPLTPTPKTVNTNLTGQYNIGYTRALDRGAAVVSVLYQGNYTKNETQQFLNTTTGNVTLKRVPQQGLYAKGSDQETTPGLLAHETGNPNNINSLSANNVLIDGNFTVPTAINLGQSQNLADPAANKFHNIGIQLITIDKSVDLLSLYVKCANNIVMDPGLTNAATWKAYWSNTNSPIENQWTPLQVQSSVVTVFDAVNNIYRIDIKVVPQVAAYFKIINTNNAVAAAGDVFVTEFEAYGTETASGSGKIKTDNTLFTQGLNLNMNVRAASTLNFAFNYLLNRADNNPASSWASIGNLAGDLFTKSTKASGSDQKTDITKSYGVTTTWMAHRLLTTTARIQRNEAYDNKKQADAASNNYSISFGSVLLPALTTNLSLIRSYTYNFGVKQTLGDSALLNIGAKLYRDVNMNTDLGYNRTTAYGRNSQVTTTQYVRSTLDAAFTPKLYGTFLYGYTTSTTEGAPASTTSTQEGGAILTYRPSRLINLSGTFRISESDSATTLTEGFLVDWLPLPVVRVNLNYQHSSTDPGPLTTDTLSSYTIWYITKFLDLQLAYGFTQNQTDKKTQNYNFGLNLNCRFW